jgi:HEAT repeat protein
LPLRGAESGPTAAAARHLPLSGVAAQVVEVRGAVGAVVVAGQRACRPGPDRYPGHAGVWGGLQGRVGQQGGGLTWLLTMCSIRSPSISRFDSVARVNQMKWWKRKSGGPEPVESPAEAEARFRRENPVEQVRAVLRDSDHAVRRDAARMLARQRDPKAIEPLCEALGKERNLSLRESAAEAIINALAEIGGQEVENFLCSLLKEDRYWQPIRVDIMDEPDIDAATEWIAPALVQLGGVDLLLRGLLDALADERSEIRAHAAQELANITYRGMDHDDDDDDGYVTLFGEGVLTDVHRESMYGPLCLALGDKSARVRERAVVALGHLGNANALDGIIACLNDDDGRVRYFAAEALGDLGDARAIEPLRRFADGDDSAVAVREALAKLTGR